jgi:hypothetical protein
MQQIEVHGRSRGIGFAGENVPCESRIGKRRRVPKDRPCGNNRDDSKSVVGRLHRNAFDFRAGVRRPVRMRIVQASARKNRRGEMAESIFVDAKRRERMGNHLARMRMMGAAPHDCMKRDASGGKRGNYGSHDSFSSIPIS